MVVLMHILRSFFVLLFALVLTECNVPSGACFVATKLRTPSEELPKPLISPGSPGYNAIWNQFIDPMLKSIPQSDHILNSSTQFVGSSKGETKTNKLRRYHKMRKNVEIYYIDHFNDPRDSDISIGIWSISFGQFVFKFTEPIPGIPDTIIFNGLLPAVGITHTNIDQWRNKYPNGKTKDKEQKTHKKIDTEEEEKVEERRRLGFHLIPFESSKIDGTSKLHYEQVITPNGKGGKYLEFWVVHNDPNVNTAYAIAASTHLPRLFSENWADGHDYCTKYGSNTAKEQYGDCDEVHSDIDEQIITVSEDHPFCKKIILCKNGAFKFVFEQGKTQDIESINVAAALLSEPCAENNCKYTNLVSALVRYGSGDHVSMCPRPSINLKFECSKHWITREDIFTDYEFKPSLFYGKRDKMEYRVIPPERIPNKEGGGKEEEEMNDPYACGIGLFNKDETAKNRPRFQIKFKNGEIKTCCIVRPPKIGTGLSIPYYWPDKRDYNGNGAVDGEQSNEKGNDEDPRTRNRIPESAVVGKAPRDKDFPSKGIIDRVVGYRIDHGMSKAEAYEKKVTPQEYKAIIQNEEAVKDPADPKKHQLANDTNSKSMIHAFYVVTISLFFIGISSLFLLPQIHS